MMRYGWLLAGVLVTLAGCRQADGPMGGSDTGVLVVQSDPPGGAVQLDGNDTGKVTPDTLRGVGGLHQVTVTLDSAQLTFGYAAQVVVQATDTLILNGPLMARCQAGASQCAAGYRLQYDFGDVRFAVNGLGPLFLQSGAGQGLYWPGDSDNSYLSTATPVFAGEWGGTPVSTGIYDTDFFAGRPAPVVASDAGHFMLTQSTWILPPSQAQPLIVARGLAVRQRMVAMTSLAGVFAVELTFRNITADPLYGTTDPSVVAAGGVTFDNCYIGLALDPDIGEASDDWLSYDGAQSTVYAYDANFSEPVFTVQPNTPALVGLRVLDKPAGTDVVLNGWAVEYTADWQAATTSQVAGYGMLSGLQSYAPDQPGTTIGHLPPGQGDIRTVATVGPLQLAPGDSARVVLAIAVAPPSPGTFTSGTIVAPGDPEDTSRPLYAIAGGLRDRLAAAASLLGELQ